MRFKTAICDDEQSGVDMLKHYLQHYNIETGVEFDISSFSDPNELLFAYQSPGVFDFVFLDMEMPVNGIMYHGIDVAKKIRSLPDNDVRIIFVTNYPQYMHLGYDVQASHYLCKDISLDKFDSIMDCIIALFRKDCSYIEIKSKRDEWIVLKVKDIYYIRSYPGKRDYIEYVTATGTLEEHRSILSASDQLSACGFAFSNKNHLVNLIHLQRYSKEQIVLDSGHLIELSRYYRKPFLEAFTENILSRT